jgi:hypothetical protein
LVLDLKKVWVSPGSCVFEAGAQHEDGAPGKRTELQLLLPQPSSCSRALLLREEALEEGCHFT